MIAEHIPALLEALAARAGRYTGQGKSHEGEPFTGELELAPLADASGIGLSFTAIGADGTLYHREESVIGTDGEGGLLLTVRGSNHPEPVPHHLRREEAADHSFRAFVFVHGEVENRESFREEIALDLWENGDIGYRYAWGMPGGEFAPRSGVRMARVA